MSYKLQPVTVTDHWRKMCVITWGWKEPKTEIFGKIQEPLQFVMARINNIKFNRSLFVIILWMLWHQVKAEKIVQMQFPHIIYIHFTGSLNLQFWTICTPQYIHPNFSGQMWVKIVDLLLMAKFWASSDHFNVHRNLS